MLYADDKKLPKSMRRVCEKVDACTLESTKAAINNLLLNQMAYTCNSCNSSLQYATNVKHVLHWDPFIDIESYLQVVLGDISIFV